MPPSPHAAATIDKVDFYYNPEASYANLEETKREQREIAEFFGLSVSDDTELIDTRPTEEMIAERYSTAARVGRLSISKAGDGSATELIDSSRKYMRARRLLSEAVRNIPLLGVTGSGNGLNLHTSLNGAEHARSLIGLLRSGKATVGTLYPMVCTLPDGEDRTVTSDAGFGGSAHVNAVLESKREEWRNTWRRLRVGRESLESLKQYAGYDTRFSIQSEELQGILRYRVLAGLDLITVPNFIKVGHVPIPLLGDEVFALQTYLPADRLGRIVDTLVGGVRLGMGIPVGASISLPPGEHMSITIDKATGPVSTQFDGDPGPKLQEGDSANFRRSQTGLLVLCNKDKLNA